MLQHCPPELKTRLTSQENWDQVRVDRDVVGLLKIIRDIAHDHDESKLGLMAIIEYDMELYLGFQGKTKDCDDYMAVFKARVDTINAHKGLAGKHPGHVREKIDRVSLEKGLTKSAIKSFNDAELKALNQEVQEIACKEYLAVLFIKQADKVWYGELKTTLANGHLHPNLTGCDYPKTLEGALRILKGYTSISNIMRHNNNNNGNRDGVAFI